MQCPNCGSVMSPEVDFCPHCGQKNTDGRVTFRELLDDLFEAIFNIDSKVFRTLGGLIRPGKLTIDFFKGRQKRYVNPLRLFFVSTLILFGTISFLGQHGINNFLEKEVSEFGSSMERSGYRQIFLSELDSSMVAVREEFKDQPLSEAVLDSLESAMDMENRDSFTVNIVESRGLNTFDNRSFKIATKDLVQKNIDELPGQYGVTNWLGEIIMKQQLKLILEPGNFTVFLLGNFTWMVLLMMPAVGLVLKMLYIRRRIFYIEHLVFLFHYHSFAFLLLAVGLLLSQYWGPLIYWLLLGIGVYYLWAMKSFYQQGWGKTFIKYLLLNFSYLFILTFFFTMTILVGIFIF